MSMTTTLWTSWLCSENRQFFTYVDAASLY